MPERLVYSVGEVSRLLHLGRGLTYEMIREGRIPAIRFGRKIVVPRAQLEAMLAARPREAGGES